MSMKLSSRGRYGLRAMVDLAMHENGPVLLKDIAARQKISMKYLEQLITPLRAAGLVRGLRGAHGGYSLARPADHIHLDEIIEALEGIQQLNGCMSDDCCCPMDPICATHEVLVEIYASVKHILHKSTLKDLIDRQHTLNNARPPLITFDI